jgi:hypothetical protein
MWVYATCLLKLLGKEPDLTLAETEWRLMTGLGCARRTVRSIASSVATRSASKKQRTRPNKIDPNVAEATEIFKGARAGLDPRKLIFVDETGTRPNWTYPRPMQKGKAADRQGPLRPLENDHFRRRVAL